MDCATIDLASLRIAGLTTHRVRAISEACGYGRPVKLVLPVVVHSIALRAETDGAVGRGAGIQDLLTGCT